MLSRIRFAGRMIAVATASLFVAAVVLASLVDMTIEDFFVPGTQMGAIGQGVILPSSNCAACHSGFDTANEPYALWQGSLMGNAGRDPLFFAQMTLANQDVANAGYYCMRCHVPDAIVSGHAMPADGSALTSADRAQGVSCHLCHSMVDPVYQPGISPPEDEAILAALGSTNLPQHIGNAMFVLDPQGRRRSARTNAQPPHEMLPSRFHADSRMCGTCHEVGNVAVTRQSDGTYAYNTIGQPSPTTNPDHQFPLERTFSEWRLSEFARGGVNMSGRFGGAGATVVSSCQDCHMPRAAAKLCVLTPSRPDARRHEFAGAAAQVLDLIAKKYQGDSTVSQTALTAGRSAAVSMLQRAASLQLTDGGTRLAVRIINESGHKLPTGHIEGRRVWASVRFLTSAGRVIGEHGRYDLDTAELDETTTTVFEMHVGLSPAAAAATGLTPGPTGRMALADTIVKDNRIPPRGFSNTAFAAAGAPVVGAAYADGQHWADQDFPIRFGAARAEVALLYLNTPKDYIEHLRDANVTDTLGVELHNLWSATDKGAPITMATQTITLTVSDPADFDRNGVVSIDDLLIFINAWFAGSAGADADGSGLVEIADIFAYFNLWFS